MNNLSKATQRCIEDFVTRVLDYVPARRIMSNYEKRAIGYALYTILRDQELFWKGSSRLTEEDEVQKKALRFEFHISNGLDGLGINQFFDLAEAVSEYIVLENSIFDEIDAVDDKIFSLFLELVFLFHQWEKNYAEELAAVDDYIEF